MFDTQVHVLHVQRLSVRPVTVDLSLQLSDDAVLNLGRAASPVESYCHVTTTTVNPHAMLVTKI